MKRYLRGLEDAAPALGPIVNTGLTRGSESQASTPPNAGEYQAGSSDDPHDFENDYGGTPYAADNEDSRVQPKLIPVGGPPRQRPFSPRR